MKSRSLTINLSDRGLPLIFWGIWGNPILTIESYLKWYDIYIVENGKVRKLPGKYRTMYEKENQGSCAWSDHIPTPWFCRWLENHFEWDGSSLDMIFGRWLLEGRSEIPKELYR